MNLFAQLTACLVVYFWCTAAQATSFLPYAESTITDSNGRYYVVVKRKDKDSDDPVTLTIAEQRAGTPPVQNAVAKTKDGDSNWATVDPRIRVRDGDIVHGRVELDRAPRKILVSSTGRGVVILDKYGFNGAKDNDFVFYSLKGECLQRKDRDDLFTFEQRRTFTPRDGYLIWLSGCWIDEQRGHVVIVGSAEKSVRKPIISVSLDTGTVAICGPEVVDRAIVERNPAALSRALELGREMKLRGAIESLPGIIADQKLLLGQRLRAAVLLVLLGDPIGGTLISQTVQRGWETDAAALKEDEQDAVYYAIEHSVDVLGEAALPLLKKSMEKEPLDYPSAFERPFRLLRRKAVPTLISVLEDDRYFDSQLEAATCLGYVGSDAEDAIPALIKALHKKNVKMRGDFAIRLNTGAIWALKRMGTKAAAAVPDLEQLAMDPDEDVRRSARDAVDTIQRKAE